MFKNIFIGLLTLFLAYLFCFNYTEPTELGIARNIFTGAMWEQDGGAHFSYPWIRVACIDTRPVRVGVQSAGHGFSQKLVQFNKEYWHEFVQVEGFRYYWWANRFSFNSGYNEEYRGMKDILRGYAYSSKKYSFIVILNKYEE